MFPIRVPLLLSPAGGVGAPSSDLQRFKGHTRPVTDLCVSPSGTTLVSASEDGTVRVWDVRSRQVTATVDSHKGEQCGSMRCRACMRLCTCMRWMWRQC
jgi:WD40 repeat protein